MADSNQTPQSEPMTEDDIYVLLKGPALIGSDQGKVEITILDKSINPNQEPIVFAREKVTITPGEIIAEFTPEIFALYQSEPNNFRLEAHIIPTNPATEPRMNPTDPPKK